MREETITADRLIAFSDGVFAVIVTVMVLELKAPDQPAFSALWVLWPTAISYAVSYLFIAIIWINHHHLMRFVGPPTPGLVWINFVHLFMVSLLPFATAWVARTGLASPAVVLYAGLFVCVDVAYNVFEHRVLAHADTARVSAGMRRMARRRSLFVLTGFTTAMLVALIAPRIGFGLICAALILHLRPEARGFRSMITSRIGCEQQTRKGTMKLLELLNLSHRPEIARWAPFPLRLIVGLGFMQHGMAKLARGPDVFAAILHAIGVPAPHLMAWATIAIELLGGLAALVGAFVPLASIPMAAVLLVAVFTVQLPYGFSSIKLIGVTAAGAQFGPPGYETNLLYLACLAALVLGGSGPLAINGRIGKQF